MEDSHLPVHYLHFTSENHQAGVVNTAIEAPVTLFLNGESWLTFQCTPVDIESLAVGFLYNEGFVESLREIENIHLCAEKTIIEIWLNHPVKKPGTWHRSSGCFNGLSTDESDRKKLEYVSANFNMQSQEVFPLIEEFLHGQRPRKESGGIHTSALAEGKEIVFQIIDIGRHNTFDKLAGRMLLDAILLNSPVLLTTGRISSEQVYKSVKMRMQFLISLRSASQAAIELAERWGITLISGANHTRFNLLSHPERILIDSKIP